MAADFQFKGSYPPVITPFRDGEVDYEAYAGLIDFQVREGSHGILVNGTTAEPSTLTVDERNRLVDVALKTVDGRIPVVAATGSQSLAETRALTEHAASAGADALLIVTPYYIRPPQAGLIDYYLEARGPAGGLLQVDAERDTGQDDREQQPGVVGGDQ